MRHVALALFCVLAACAGPSRLERASVAEEAQTAMIGLTEAEVRACMGEPTVRADGVWTYEAVERKRRSTTVGGVVTPSDVTFNCIADLSFTDGRVSDLRYSGRTGGLLTEGEQCGRLVRLCVP